MITQEELQELSRKISELIDTKKIILFGSYAKGIQQVNSDIDLAIVLDDKEMSFDTEVQLMIMRNGDDVTLSSGYPA